MYVKSTRVQLFVLTVSLISVSLLCNGKKRTEWSKLCRSNVGGNCKIFGRGSSDLLYTKSVVGCTCELRIVGLGYETYMAYSFRVKYNEWENFLTYRYNKGERNFSYIVITNLRRNETWQLTRLSTFRISARINPPKICERRKTSRREIARRYSEVFFSPLVLFVFRATRIGSRNCAKVCKSD